MVETDNRVALQALLADAAECRRYDSPPDAIVMRAIGLGLSTRRELKDLLGFGYDVIEKCLERNSADLQTETRGQIEWFTLVANGAPAPKVECICVDCGSPRSYGSGQRCKKCYDAKAAANKKPEEVEAVTTESQNSDTETLCFCGRVNPPGGKHRGTHRGSAATRAARPTSTTTAPAAAERPVVTSFVALEIAPTLPVKMTPQQFIERFNSFDDFEIDEFFTKMNDQSTDTGIVWGVLPEEPKHSKQFFSVSYNVLVTMLDDNMNDDQKRAVWTLICYLKRLQKDGFG